MIVGLSGKYAVVARISGRHAVPVLHIGEVKLGVLKSCMHQCTKVSIHVHTLIIITSKIPPYGIIIYSLLMQLPDWRLDRWFKYTLTEFSHETESKQDWKPTLEINDKVALLVCCIISQFQI